MSLVIESILCVVLFNVFILIKERRLRRLASARLEIVQTVNTMEQLMSEGKIRHGDVLHDEFYAKMLNSQYNVNYRVHWKFWQVSPKTKEMREKLSAEIANQSDLGKVLWAYARADFNEFRNRHPFKSLAFSLWILFCAGGLVMLVGGLISVVAVNQLKKTLQERLIKFKHLVAEWYASYGLTAST